MRKDCLYCRVTFGQEPGEGVTHGICSSCMKVDEAVRDEIADLLADVRHGRALSRLQPPLFHRHKADGDVRLTPVNVGILIAAGVSPHRHALLAVGIAEAERDLAVGRRAV